MAATTQAKAGGASMPWDGDTVAAKPSGDPIVGKKVFQQCAACHKTTSDSAHRLGPNLGGIIGRHVGAAANYKYSAAMANADFVWTLAKLEAYLWNPQKFLPGTKTPFSGFHKNKKSKRKKAEKKTRDVAAYLYTLK